MLETGIVTEEKTLPNDFSIQTNNKDSGTVEPAETVNLGNPKLEDLFDIDRTRIEEEQWINLLLLTPSNGYAGESWTTSFEEIIDLIGKPHGFRQGHPDTLVWVTDTGKYYAIRFELDEESGVSYKNAYDQFIHSHSAFHRLVQCQEVTDPDQYPLADLPIQKIEKWDFDQSIPLEEQFFDYQHQYLPPNDYIKSIRIEGISLYDIVSFLGKPHAVLSGNSIFRLVWLSDNGTKYIIEFTVKASGCNYHDIVLSFLDTVAGPIFVVPKRLGAGYDFISTYVVSYID